MRKGALQHVPEGASQNWWARHFADTGQEKQTLGLLYLGKPVPLEHFRKRAFVAQEIVRGYSLCLPSSKTGSNPVGDQVVQMLILILTQLFCPCRTRSSPSPPSQRDAYSSQQETQQATYFTLRRNSWGRRRIPKKCNPTPISS